MVPHLREEVVKVPWSFEAFYGAAQRALRTTKRVRIAALICWAATLACCTQTTEFPADRAWRSYHAITDVDARDPIALLPALHDLKHLLLESEEAPALVRWSCVELLTQWHRLRAEAGFGSEREWPTALADQFRSDGEQRVRIELRERLAAEAARTPIAVATLLAHAETIVALGGVRGGSSAVTLRALETVNALLAGEREELLRAEAARTAESLAAEILQQLIAEALMRGDENAAVRGALAAAYLQGADDMGWARVVAWCEGDASRDVLLALLAAQYEQALSRPEACDIDWLLLCSEHHDLVIERFASRILRFLGIAAPADLTDEIPPTPRD
jgi:hypothetical protein